MKNIITIALLLFAFSAFGQYQGNIKIDPDQSKAKQYIPISFNGKELLSNRTLRPGSYDTKGNYSGWLLTDFLEAIQEKIAVQINDSISGISGGGENIMTADITQTEDHSQDADGFSNGINNLNQFNLSSNVAAGFVALRAGATMVNQVVANDEDVTLYHDDGSSGDISQIVLGAGGILAESAEIDLLSLNISGDYSEVYVANDEVEIVSQGDNLMNQINLGYDSIQINSQGLIGQGLSNIWVKPEEIFMHHDNGGSSDISQLSLNDNGVTVLSDGNIRIGTADTVRLIGTVNQVETNLLFPTLGTSLTIKSGANQRAGNATLIGGSLTIANTSVTANTIVMLTRKSTGGTIGFAVTYTLIPATSFTITSDNVLDTSTYSYLLIETN